MVLSETCLIKQLVAPGVLRRSQRRGTCRLVRKRLLHLRRMWGNGLDRSALSGKVSDKLEHLNDEVLTRRVLQG